MEWPITLVTIVLKERMTVTPPYANTPKNPFFSGGAYGHKKPTMTVIEAF